MKSGDRSSTQQEQMRKHMRKKKQEQQQLIDHSIGKHITPRKIEPSCSNFPSPATAPPLKRGIVVHNYSLRAKSVGRTTKRLGRIGHGDEPSSWLNRKFYIVENNGKPSEVYCTDLIHRAKQYHQPRLQQLDSEDSHHRFLRVVDRWREEWNHGVQMPLGTSKDTFFTEPTNLFPDLGAPEECFKLPYKLVSLDTPGTNRYTNETHFKFIVKSANHGKNNNDQAGRRLRPADRLECEHYQRMPRQQLIAQFYKIRRLRMQFERARNLCHMVAKREKLKKQCLEQLEQQVKLTASNAFGRVPPVSSRSMERLLSEWRNTANFRPMASAAETIGNGTTRATTVVVDGRKRKGTQQ